MTHAQGEFAPTSAALDIQPSTPQPSSPDAPEAVRSPLGNLRAQREARLKKLYLDLRVPGWGDDPELDPRVFVYVRCRPLKPSELAGIQEAQSKRGKNAQGKLPKDQMAWIDRANADLIATACLEVWAYSGPDEPDPATLSDDERLSLNAEDWHGAKTRFDGDLADALGMERNFEGKPPAAVDVVRGLFLHDGDVMQAVERLTKWSNLRANQEEQDFTTG
ncbi:hypothetical protein LQ327_09010 [Actinomycetospora endophytica]|uniref:Tail assembly chaperone n=1 Tax=Actinomycetospora endophytica TaxID=2291215 RepID=A0ABS8P5K6_9PSEU|nr:hypothetical protein [Actinomycetospora endophytica]MCD2193521.1 hypothetical protein [Actinomycetospora endophytica]